MSFLSVNSFAPNSTGSPSSELAFSLVAIENVCAINSQFLLARQFDIREPHNCKSDDAVQLIDLHNHIGPSAEAKCVAVNHRRPEQLAVGASDVYARIYDRRMIRLNRVS